MSNYDIKDINKLNMLLTGQYQFDDDIVSDLNYMEYLSKNRPSHGDSPSDQLIMSQLH